MLQGESISEQQTASASGEQSNSASTSGDDQVTAGTKRSSNDEGDDDSGVKRPYGYHQGAYGGWTVVAERSVNSIYFFTVLSLIMGHFWLTNYTVHYCAAKKAHILTGYRDFHSCMLLHTICVCQIEQKIQLNKQYFPSASQMLYKALTVC